MPIIGNFPSGSGGSGGGGLALAAVSGIQTLTAAGKVYIKWTDPDDLVVAGSPLASWGGTLLVRKAGSAPVSRRDGTVVLDSKTRNAYQNSYFCDSGLTDGVEYFYKFFPYTTSNAYTDSTADEFSATPNPVAVGDVSGITLVAAGNGKLSIKWTDPAATVVTDGITRATWASTIVVVKEGSYATSPTDPDAAYTHTSTTRNGYSSTPLVATGLNNGTTYYVSLFPMSTDGKANTNTANRKTGVANRITISTDPSQSGSLTFNTNPQSPTWSNYNSAQLTLGGVTSGTNAGSYNATFTPKDDYMWSDGTTVAKTVSWSIGKATVEVPTTSSSFTYDGNQKSPVWLGYDSAKMTLGGTSSATNAGTHTATFTPTANYKWSDGTTSAKSVSWSIAKAAGSSSLSATSVTLNASNLTKNVTVTRSGDGAITASSSDTSVATVSVSGNTVTISHVNQKTGTATITVKVAAGTNYTAPTDKTVSVTAQFMPTKKALNQQTWAEIKQVSDADQGANYWAVGDTKTITINGKAGNYTFSNLSVGVFILGFNHNSAKEGTNRIHFQIGKINGTAVALCDSQYNNEQTSAGYFHMNTSRTNSGGWNNSAMRKTLLGNSNSPTSPLTNSLMAALPSDLRAVMKSVTKYTDNTGGGSNTASYVTATTDYLFLLSEFEVFGTRNYANSAEQNYQLQYDYYKAGNSKIAYNHSANSTAVWWWLRSPYYNGGNTFCNVANGGNTDANTASWSAGVRPGFSV